MSWLSNIADDVGSFINRTVGTSGGLLSDLGVKPFKVPAPIEDALGIGAAALAAPFVLPEIGSAIGGGLSELGGLFDTGATAATAPLDLSAAATAGGDALLPATATLDAGGIPSGLAGAFDATTPSVLSGADAATALGSTPLLTTGDLAGSAALGGIDTSIPVATAGSGGILSSIENALAPVADVAKKIAPIAGLGGLGYNLYSGYEQKKQLDTLNQQEQQQAQQVQQAAQAAQQAAQPELNQGQLLQQYLTTGTLPQAFQSQLDQQIAAAKASIVQGYATRGMSTNPNQNSALAQDLSNVDVQAQSLKANLEQTLSTAGSQMVQQANALLQSGVSATSISAQIPIAMQQLDIQLGKQTSDSITQFAAAMNTGGQVKVNPNALTINLSQAA